MGDRTTGNYRPNLQLPLGFTGPQTWLSSTSFSAAESSNKTWQTKSATSWRTRRNIQQLKRRWWMDKQFKSDDHFLISFCLSFVFHSEISQNLWEINLIKWFSAHLKHLVLLYKASCLTTQLLSNSLRRGQTWNIDQNFRNHKLWKPAFENHALSLLPPQNKQNITVFNMCIRASLPRTEDV